MKIGMTGTEKILARASGKKSVKPGDVVIAKVSLATAHDALGKVVGPFGEMGCARVWDPDKIVVSIDHWVPATSESAAELHKKVRKFVREQGIRRFFDVGRGGVCHQVVAENGYVKPSMVVVGTDSHTTTLGAFGAFATGIGVTEMAAVFCTGEIWLKVPKTLRVDVSGKPERHVGGKDIILRAIADLGVDSAVYMAVEFGGPSVSELTVSQRMTIANMATEMGAKNSLIGNNSKMGFVSDNGAFFVKEHHIDIGGLEPQVACPPGIDNVIDVSTAARRNIRIDQVFIGSCTNGRLDDLEAVASILKGEKIHRDVRLIISPASWKIYQQAMRRGFIRIFLDAEATVTNPGCSACFGGHIGILASGEACLSTGNRNFTGRMGASGSSVYMASPAVAAATALYGRITPPREA